MSVGVNKWLNPVQGTITSSFGSRINPVLNKSEFHNGLDIAVIDGTNVLAVKNGVVTETGNSKTYGNYIKYKTDGNYLIMYAHLQKVLLKKGDNVTIGQTVALSGHTGMVTGPHLHYTIWIGDELVNPMDYVNLPYTEDVKNEYVQRGEFLG